MVFDHTFCRFEGFEPFSLEFLDHLKCIPCIPLQHLEKGAMARWAIRPPIKTLFWQVSCIPHYDCRVWSLGTYGKFWKVVDSNPQVSDWELTELILLDVGPPRGQLTGNAAGRKCRTPYHK